MDPAACASRAPLRVLHFRSTSTFAGPERSLLTLGGRLHELGVDVKIIALYRRRRPEPAIHRLVELGRREPLDVEQWNDRSKFSWWTVRRLADELRRGKYDLLVNHDHKTNLMGYLAARRSKIPCLSIAHGYDLSLLRMHLYRRIDLLVLRRFPRIVAVSESLRRELIAAGLSPDRICVIPTSIDGARFAEGAADRASEWRRRAAEPGAPVIVTVGRLYRQKGLEYFVQSAAQIHEVVPRARFWIVGEGVQRAQLEAQIRGLGLEGVVTLLGGQRDIAAIMAASDVFVMPSLGEGLSNVLLEAMALGKPVVATRVGGNPEIVRDGETGWLVPPRHPVALATAVLKILKDPDLGARIGAQGRDFVASRFGATLVTAQMVEVFRQVAASRGSRGDDPAPHTVTPDRRAVSGRLGQWARLGLRGILHLLCLPLRPSAPRVLLWHSLDPSRGPVSLRPELFAKQIAWLARKGYEAWPASRYVDALIKKDRLPDRLVVLTFDDGYANVLEQGLPVLREHGFSATVFLATGVVGQMPRWATYTTHVMNERILMWGEAESAAREGLEFESHTHSHPFLEEQPGERVREELARSRVELEKRGLGRGRLIAWPYGAYETRLGTLAVQERYTAGFLDDFDWSLRRNPDLFRLNRIPVNPELGVFGVAFSLGKGVEVWGWLRDRIRPAEARRKQPPGVSAAGAQ
jgi:glycosyltransferase involved in cell wall biosynthesis/peptidoglycan/xylan/chitin deacetylase (PgdA/CDA1 family)